MVKTQRKEGIYFQAIKKDNKLPYEDNTFDVISILHTLHHIEDRNNMLNEIKRVLRPDGVLIVREHDIKTELEKKLVDVEHFLYMLSIKSRFNLSSIENYESFYMTRKETQNILDEKGFESDKMYKSKKNNYNKSYIEIYKEKVEAEEEVEEEVEEEEEEVEEVE